MSTDAALCASEDPAPKPSLSCKRRFNAAPERDYAAWTDPAQIAQWFGPPHVAYVEAQEDARDNHDKGSNGGLDALERHFASAPARAHPAGLSRAAS